jgi:hypothetical protein
VTELAETGHELQNLTTKKPFIRRSKNLIAIGCRSLVQVTDEKPCDESY